MGLLQMWVHPLYIYIFDYSYKILFRAFQKDNHLFILSTDSLFQNEFRKENQPIISKCKSSIIGKYHIEILSSIIGK